MKTRKLNVSVIGIDKRKDEMANIIYDTLFENIEYPQFCSIIDDIEWQEVDARKGEIAFLHDGFVYSLSVSYRKYDPEGIDKE